MHRATLAIVLALIPAALTACTSGQGRPIDRVIVSGDEAFEQANYARARADYQEWVDRYPESAQARLKLGKTLLRTGETQEAATNLQVAYDLRPARDEDEVLDLLATALVEANRHDELFRVLEERVQLRGDVQDYLRLARFSLRAGDADRARQALLVADRLDAGRSPKVPAAWIAFAREVGDTELERRALTRLLAIQPGNEDARRRLRELGQIPGPTLAVEPEGG